MADRIKRVAVARILHAGCNAMNSLLATTWRAVIVDGDLSDKEYRLLKQRYDKVFDCVDDVRKIAQHIERKERRRET